MVIAAAWRLPYHPGTRLSGGPGWIRSGDGVYDIDARAEKGAIPDSLPANVRSDSMRPMLQKMLADRFHLVIHRETRDVPVYAVVVAKSGPKLAKADVEEKDCPVSDTLNLLPGDPVVECHMFLEVAAEGSTRAPGAKSEDGTSLADLPSLFQIFDGLGLKLEARREMADILVIDHIERPAEN
jgi:hypothetical protein